MSASCHIFFPGDFETGVGFTRWWSSSLPLRLLASARAAFTFGDNRTRTHDADGRRAAAVRIVAGIVFDALYALRSKPRSCFLSPQIFNICLAPTRSQFLLFACALFFLTILRARNAPAGHGRRHRPVLARFAHYLLKAQNIGI